MKDLKRYSLLFVLLLHAGVGFAQQTIQFSQYVFNGLAVNSTHAGLNPRFRVGYSYDYTTSKLSNYQ